MRGNRLLALIGLLQQRRRTTVAELARDLDVSSRTILRDLDVLSAAGIPVYSERGRGGGVRLRDDHEVRLTGISSVEAEAVALISAPASVRDVALDQAFGTAVGKVAASIPAVHRHRAERTRQRLMFDVTPWFHAPTAAEPLARLRDAVWRDRVCNIDYERGDGTRRRYRIDPLALVAKVDLWYLVARTARGMRVFRVSRIRALTVTDERFERAADFDLPSFWRRWCRRFETQPVARYWVELSLTRHARDRLLERYGGWHAAALTDWPDDADRAVVTLDLESESFALGVLFDLAGDAQVIAPPELRRTLRTRAQRLLRVRNPQD